MRSTQALLPGATFETERLLTPADARAMYRANVALGPVGTETVPLGAACGRILAVPATVGEPVPADDRSTMDGFAVRSTDGTAVRRIAGEIRMGNAPPPLHAGEALRIPTGGVVPAGADAVVPIEDATWDEASVTVAVAPQPGAFITPRGADLAAGVVALPAGRRIGGPELSILATLGWTGVPVYRRPRVAIVSTGDELVEPGQTPGPGQVRDSNRWAIAGSLTALGAEPVHLPNAPDDLEALRASLGRALAEADAVILTGGSSVGERDLTPEAIAAFDGPGVVVHGLRVKPGKPTVLAAIGTQLVIGLPGNPASALMILEAVCAPLIAALTGATEARPATVVTTAGAAFDGRPGWTWFVPAELRAIDGGEAAFPLPLRSAHTSLLARAHGYAVLAEDRSHVDVGAPLEIVRFSAGGRP